MHGSIAVLNAGSSSIKFALFAGDSDETPLFRGSLQQIGVSPHLRVTDPAGAVVEERTWSNENFDHRAATREVLQAAVALRRNEPVAAIGHRVVHGGVKYAAPVQVTPALLDELATLVPLAPLHQPHNLAPIHTILEAAPHIPQVACFDTAFHRSQPHLAQMFALPRSLSGQGIRRYGFHGLSYEYVCAYLAEFAPNIAAGRLVIAHLGNGASLCAVHGGRSIASTMGFTAVDGLMMGTRCGALDPGVMIHLMDVHGMGARELEDLIYRRSGLLGVSGVSSDMRELRASDQPTAAEAIDLFVYRVIREIGSMAAALGGLDGLVFTGGIGEHDGDVRAAVGAGCGWLGVEIDPALNARGAGAISAASSRTPVLVVSTDEERMVARHTRSLLSSGSAAA
jgi:acetate kinase